MSDRLLLVADDDVFIGEAIQTLVQRSLACKVAAVKDGDAAVEYLKHHMVDVLLADMMMPGIQGLELIEAARRISPDTDIMVMTAYTADFPFVEVIQAGATDFIAKPHAHEELKAKLVRIFQERETREALQSAEKKYRSIFELNTDGMAIAGAKTLEILDVNSACCRLLTQERRRLIGRNVSSLLPQSEQERFEHGLELFAPAGRGTLGDITFRTSTGAEISLDVSATFICLSNEEVVCLTFRDVTEKRLLEQRLTEVAQRDALTGLYNQRSFMLHLKMAVAGCRATHRKFTLLSIDIDDFKRCNDVYGHPAGDKVLQNLGKIIQTSIRESMDEGFRTGGDEFVVILGKADAHGAQTIVDRIRKEFRMSENHGASLSIGIATYQPGMTSESIARVADQALYQAKALGKNKSWVAVPAP